LICFRGGGCAPHHVPALCHEIASRREFLTVFAGTAYTNRGVFQAQFEFQSLIGELLDMEVVGASTYDWGWAAAKALRLGLTVTKRPVALVMEGVGPRRLEEIVMLCGSASVEVLPLDHKSGSMRVDALRTRLASGDVGALYVEMPTYLGAVDAGVARTIEIAKESTVVSVLGVDPLALGVLESPGVLGADISCGSLQGLGIPMYAGGGEAGFLACRDQPRLVSAFSDLLVGAVETDIEGELTYDWVNFEDTHYGLRERASDFTGTTQSIWSIVAAAYLALAGHHGLTSIGDMIISGSEYLRSGVAALPGVSVREVGGISFKEHVVVLPAKVSIDRVNHRLLEAGVMGGIDLRFDFPWLGNGMLVCVTEEHTRQDIDVFIEALDRAVRAEV